MIRALATLVALTIPTLVRAAEIDRDAVVEIYSEKGDRTEIGAGFFISSDGKLVTAYHVIANSDAISIYDFSGTKFSSVFVVGVDPHNDLAVLKINRPDCHTLALREELPKRSLHYTLMGHPDGILYQTIEANATQNGFARSSQINDPSGNPIFASDVPIFPITATIYGGMSGSPIVNEDGDVVAVLTGSLSPGGSIAWGIPTATINIALQNHPVTLESTQDFAWPRFDMVTPSWRGFSKPKTVNIQETIDWLNAKWQTAGVSTVQLLIGHNDVQDAKFSYVAESSQLTVTVEYTHNAPDDWGGNDIRHVYKIQLRNALGSKASDYFKLKSGYYVEVVCPNDRSCIDVERYLNKDSRWVKVASAPKNATKLTDILFRDLDTARRVSAALTNLVRLSGGPVAIDDLFGNH